MALFPYSSNHFHQVFYTLLAIFITKLESVEANGYATSDRQKTNIKPIFLFQVGSYSYDMTKMLFRISRLTFIQKQSIILDYSISIRNLREIDKTFLAGALGNYSLAGFEMVSQRP